jgi:hypothetical protein
MSRASLAAKRVIRPLIPDSVMARYRLHQHSAGSRSNIDVYVSDQRKVRGWLNTTPDTYRVVLPVPEGAGPDDAVGIGEDTAVANVLLADASLAAGVVAHVGRLGLVGRRRSEPEMMPIGISVRRAVWDEVGGAPPGPSPLPGLLQRIRDAGHRIGLVPLDQIEGPAARHDPIQASPVVVLSAVPIDDIGGGSRAAQLAVEFLLRGRHVSFVNLFGTQESVDLGLRFIHPALEQVDAARFDPAGLDERCATTGIVLVEAPAPQLIEPAMTLQSLGWRLGYDLIDDWSAPSLGGEWYRRDREEALLDAADFVVASAPDLVERCAGAGRDAVLIPNGVNATLFSGFDTAAPDDLPVAETLIGYHGSLYGDWFDWAALGAVADAYSGAVIVVIGDDKAPRPSLPDNVRFLGLKAQGDLPPYLQRLDVGLIPFTVTPTTHAVSPLKAYEYLASGVPVAAPPLRSLQDLEGISTADDLVQAVAMSLAGERPDGAAVLAAHSWSARIDSLHRAIGDDPAPASAEGPVIVTRPVTHWDAQDRLVR